MQAGEWVEETFAQQVSRGARFQFGRNWRGFLRQVDEERIVEAERSLTTMLGSSALAGKIFLDIGCGSGLFSLAACRLGATRVHSFDYDPESVACARELKRRWFPAATHWTIERGDVLDGDYLGGLGEWDIVYSWGVLHHTGDLRRALTNAASPVARGGQLFVAVYNDQGKTSQRWRTVKALYNRHRLTRGLVLSVFVPGFALAGLVVDLLRLRHPLRRYREYKATRGMSILHDWIDWLGGLPFEVARPEQVFDLCRARGLELRRLKTCGGGLGCNEFVFVRT